MEQAITLEFILNTKFDNDGLFLHEEKSKGLYKMPSDYKLPATPEENNLKLRRKIEEVFENKFNGSKTRVNLECAISESTFKSYLLGKRRMSREALARFCVGAQISVELANEMFLLHGHGLDNVHNCLDAIVCYCLNHKETLDEMIKICNDKGIGI